MTLVNDLQKTTFMEVDRVKSISSITPSEDSSDSHNHKGDGALSILRTPILSGKHLGTTEQNLSYDSTRTLKNDSTKAVFTPGEVPGPQKHPDVEAKGRKSPDSSKQKHDSVLPDKTGTDVTNGISIENISKILPLLIRFFHLAQKLSQLLMLTP